MKFTLFLSLFFLGAFAQAEEIDNSPKQIDADYPPAISVTAIETAEPATDEAIAVEETVVTQDINPSEHTTESPSAFNKWWESAKSNVSQTWDSDQYELYVPLRVWHNRNSYTKEKIDSFNEEPWGIGFGRYRFDEKGNWHAIFAMAFLDSHDDLEPIVGYAWQATYYPTKNIRTGVGFVAGITARSDMSYIPFPAPLPLVSVEYRRFSLQATYIPGGSGNGNVAFAWLRYQLN